MAFQTPISIKDAIDSIHTKKYLLPAIQRELVWDSDAITLLYDSLLRGYPIGSFLFWRVPAERTGDYQFYEFIRDYHSRDNTHNPKASISGASDITAILDGQQRLTALYIGLKGSFTEREPRKRRDNPDAYKKRHLYLNLRRPAHDDSGERQFDFRFLTDCEASERNVDTFWFRVSKILDIADLYEANNFLIENGLMTVGPADDGHAARFANASLLRLWSAIHHDPLINYYLEKGEELDKVLNIFIRVNSGGTPLSYSDLLLSIAAAQWTKVDAREAITAFVDELNRIRDFAFNKDWVLKSCLVLGDFADIAFKVDNFNRTNMQRIESQWEPIAEALRGAALVVSALGYSGHTLTSNYVVTPIAYHLLKRGHPANFHIASAYAADRDAINHWIARSLLRRVFGGKPDSVLRPIRDVLRHNTAAFPLAAITDSFRGTTKTIVFSDDDIEALLNMKYGDGYTFAVLSLLYPTLDFRNLFHIDHIHPKSRFTRSRLSQEGLAAEDVEYLIRMVDTLPNLQLLEGIPNQEKSATPFASWLHARYSDRSQRASFLERNFISEHAPLTLAESKTFFEMRRAELKNRLQQLLQSEP